MSDPPAHIDGSEPAHFSALRRAGMLQTLQDRGSLSRVGALELALLIQWLQAYSATQRSIARLDLGGVLLQIAASQAPSVEAFVDSLEYG